MIIIGLTGGVAMGKSVVTAQFRALGAAVYNADLAVHRLLGSGGGAVEKVAKIFPGAKKNNHIDRAALAAIVFKNPESLEKLERILHPLVREEEKAFLKKARHLGKKFVVLEIPLLFETAGDERCDATVLVSAPPFLQRQRALARPAMNADKLTQILARQMPHHHKRKRADIEIHTGLGRAHSFHQVRRIRDWALRFAAPSATIEA